MEGKGWEKISFLKKWDGIHNWESKAERYDNARKEAIKSKRIILQRGKEKKGKLKSFYKDAFTSEKRVRFDLLKIKILYTSKRLIQQCDIVKIKNIL